MGDKTKPPDKSELKLRASAARQYPKSLRAGSVRRQLARLVDRQVPRLLEKVKRKKK